MHNDYSLPTGYSSLNRFLRTMKLRTAEYYQRQVPRQPRKLLRRVFQKEVDFIRKNFRKGPLELCLRLPELTYEQVVYVLKFYNLQGYSAYCRRCSRTNHAHRCVCGCPQRRSRAAEDFGKEVWFCTDIHCHTRHDSTKRSCSAI